MNERCTDADGADGVKAEMGVGEQPDPFLFNIRVPVWKYVLRMGIISFVPSIIIAFLFSVTGILTEESGPQLGGVFHPVVEFFGIVGVSPIIETLLMCVVLRVLSLITKRRYPLAIISCIVWAGLHSLMSPVWGVVVIWPFFIFSCSYLAWRRKSWWRAVWVTCLVHMFQNLLPGIMLLVSGFL